MGALTVHCATVKLQKDNRADISFINLEQTKYKGPIII